ncbi:MAG: 3-deoxy-manno-octulosonate cytidylyltransferase [Planctomycetes bacterium]|nr:3-deoxy-manno-octulosonate cytidylyltransferase [Planctomycetota bacterium]
MKVLVVIPARYGSTRFPAKVVASDTGKFLVQHTYERALCAKNVDDVLVATDDDRVMAACKSFSGRCVMTSVDHQSGTDRIAEAVADIDADIIVNLQADEPEIDPANIDFLVDLLEGDKDAVMATLVAGFDSGDQVTDPNVVKAIIDSAGRAIYFSRSAIPYDRDSGGIGDYKMYLRHLGIYAYRKDFLMQITKQPQTPLELTEKLEQLRVIENGYSIITGKVKQAWTGIDTPDQYAEFVERQQKPEAQAQG